MGMMATNPFQNLKNVYSGSPQEQAVSVVSTGLTNPITPAVGGVFTKWIPPAVGVGAGALLATLFSGTNQDQKASTTTDATQQTDTTTVTNPDQDQDMAFLGSQDQTTTTTTSTEGDDINIWGSGNYVYGGGVMPSQITAPLQSQQAAQAQPIFVNVPSNPVLIPTASTEQTAEAKSDNSGLLIAALVGVAAFLFGRGKL